LNTIELVDKGTDQWRIAYKRKRAENIALPKFEEYDDVRKRGLKSDLSYEPNDQKN
jgi:hypothetical protein